MVHVWVEGTPSHKSQHTSPQGGETGGPTVVVMGGKGPRKL